MQGFFQSIRHMALIALILRAALPAGWMPDAHAGLTICSLGTIHHDGAPAKDQHADKECPFAAAAQMATSPEAPRIALPASHAFAATVERRYASVIAARFTPQSQRAPPLNA